MALPSKWQNVVEQNIPHKSDDSKYFLQSNAKIMYGLTFDLIY